ncbi:AEC family transporter [Microbacterium sp. M]|uniref:AEC family transporter n=1 Tax=Microbacterium sp. M TaxID=3377125 RepID=UPI0038639718
MLVLLAAIAPIILFLAGGAFLRRYVLPSPEFWAGLSWLSYWIFTPTLFISSIGGADLTTVEPGPFALSVCLPILLVSMLAFASARLTRANGPQLTSLMQGSIRINTYVGLIMASALHGEEGVATFALASAIVVPLVNVICVATLSTHGTVDPAGRRPALWRDLITNPLILGCLIGLILNMTGISVPAFLQTTLDTVSAPALLVGTLCAGAALRFAFRIRDLLDVGVASLLKLGVLPLVAVSTAIALGVHGSSLVSIVLISAVPTAPSATILAARMGGDVRLMASITGSQTVLAMATMPLVLVLADMLSA